MAPSETTTIRVPITLRDEIAHLAHERGGTMLDVVSDAIHRLTKDQWWDAVHDSINAMTPDQVAEYQANTEHLDRAAADGLRGS